MAPKARPQGAQPLTKAAQPESAEGALLKSVRASMESHLKGRRVVSLKVRQVEGRNIDGILKIEGVKGELQMVDFKATTGSGPQGALSYLEVGGRKIIQSQRSPTRQTQALE